MLLLWRGCNRRGLHMLCSRMVERLPLHGKTRRHLRTVSFTIHTNGKIIPKIGRYSKPHTPTPGGWGPLGCLICCMQQSQPANDGSESPSQQNNALLHASLHAPYASVTVAVCVHYSSAYLKYLSLSLPPNICPLVSVCSHVVA